MILFRQSLFFTADSISLYKSTCTLLYFVFLSICLMSKHPPFFTATSVLHDCMLQISVVHTHWIVCYRSLSSYRFAHSLNVCASNSVCMFLSARVVCMSVTPLSLVFDLIDCCKLCILYDDANCFKKKSAVVIMHTSVCMRSEGCSSLLATSLCVFVYCVKIMRKNAGLGGLLSASPGR